MVDKSTLLKLIRETSFETDGVTKFINKNFEKKVKNFVANEAQILFVVDYVVEGQSYGCLLCWVKHNNVKPKLEATHYEIYRKNALHIFRDKTSVRDRFDLMGTYSARNLARERKNYVDYLKKVLEIKLNWENVYIFHDHKVRTDNIYEYRVRAIHEVQKVGDVDYEMMLLDKNMVYYAPLSPSSTMSLQEYAQNTFGSSKEAWLVCAVDSGISFFGSVSRSNSLVSFSKFLNSADYYFRERAWRDVVDSIDDEHSTLRDNYLEEVSQYNTVINQYNTAYGTDIEPIEKNDGSIGLEAPEESVPIQLEVDVAVDTDGGEEVGQTSRPGEAPFPAVDNTSPTPPPTISENLFDDYINSIWIGRQEREWVEKVFDPKVEQLRQNNAGALANVKVVGYLNTLTKQQRGVAYKISRSIIKIGLQTVLGNIIKEELGLL